MRRAVTSLVVSALLAAAPRAAWGQPAPTPGQPVDARPVDVIDHRLAVWRFDALGIEPELVARLETLFRMELDRLARRAMPGRREIDRAITGAARDCTGEDRCLAAIGKRLGVDLIVAGTVGQLGDTYVLTIKAVEVATARTLRRIQSDPLRGQPDELIEGVRVAAYRLLAPDQIHGAIQLQTDVVGADVQLDGVQLGATPLPRNGLIGKLALGRHRLRVAARPVDSVSGGVHGEVAGDAYEDDIDVHFQKVSPVVVRLVPSAAQRPIERVERSPFYTKTWFLIAVGVTAVGVGAAVGYSLGRVERCSYDAQGVAHGC